ncbi:MAG: hypothetical protein AAF696_26835, partial [Bacteroidota bacterium]
FTRLELISHLRTLSNISVALETLEISMKELDSWLETEISPFFHTNHEKKAINFKANIKYLKKIL